MINGVAEEKQSMVWLPITQVFQLLMINGVVDEQQSMVWLLITQVFLHEFLLVTICKYLTPQKYPHMLE